MGTSKLIIRSVLVTICLLFGFGLLVGLRDQPGISSGVGNAAAPLATITPGLVVYGNVRDLSGAGVPDVSIYRGLASYPGVLIATTDPAGNYESEFKWIPGQELITVNADHPGLVLVPPLYMWEHYYGYERRNCSFVARFPFTYFIPFMSNLN